METMIIILLLALLLMAGLQMVRLQEEVKGRLAGVLLLVTAVALAVLPVAVHRAIRVHRVEVRVVHPAPAAPAVRVEAVAPAEGVGPMVVVERAEPAAAPTPTEE